MVKNTILFLAVLLMIFSIIGSIAVFLEYNNLVNYPGDSTTVGTVSFSVRENNLYNNVQQPLESTTTGVVSFNVK